MIIHDFASIQLEKGRPLPDDELFDDFISCYEEVFDSGGSILKRLKRAVSSLDSGAVLKSVEKINKVLPQVADNLKPITGGSELPEVIIFAGPGGWDGHGIIIEGKSYVFLDVSLWVKLIQYPGHKVGVHLAHEIVHAIHYGQNFEFYPGNFTNAREKILNRMIAEGIATYLSGVCSDSNEKDALTFGLMDDDEFDEWASLCERVRPLAWQNMVKCFSENRVDERFFNRLFFIDENREDSLKNGRFGYFFGYNIVNRTVGKVEAGALPGLKMKDFGKMIFDYFNFRDKYD